MPTKLTPAIVVAILARSVVAMMVLLSVVVVALGILKTVILAFKG